MGLGIREERGSQRPVDFTESRLDQFTPMETLTTPVVFRHLLSGLIRLGIELEMKKISRLDGKVGVDG